MIKQFLEVVNGLHTPSWLESNKLSRESAYSAPPRNLSNPMESGRQYSLFLFKAVLTSRWVPPPQYNTLFKPVEVVHVSDSVLFTGHSEIDTSVGNALDGAIFGKKQTSKWIRQDAHPWRTHTCYRNKEVESPMDTITQEMSRIRVKLKFIQHG